MYEDEYYYEARKKENAKLHSTNSDEIIGYLAEKIKNILIQKVTMMLKIIFLII